MINVIATITVKKGKKADFIRIFKANVPNVLAEEGCIEYHPTVDAATDLDAQATDDTKVVIIEKWESLDHLRAHLAAPHMVKYKKDTEGMSTGLDLRILEDA